MVMKSSLQCFLRDAQEGWHCLGLLELCLFESNSGQRRVFVQVGHIRATLGIQESKVLSLYGPMVLAPRFCDSVAPNYGGGSSLGAAESPSYFLVPCLWDSLSLSFRDSVECPQNTPGGFRAQSQGEGRSSWWPRLPPLLSSGQKDRGHWRLGEWTGGLEGTFG